MAKSMPFKLTTPLLFGSIEENSSPANLAGGVKTSQIISAKLCTERKRNIEMPMVTVVGHAKTVNSVCQLERQMEIQSDLRYIRNYKKKQKTEY